VGGDQLLLEDVDEVGHGSCLVNVGAQRREPTRDAPPRGGAEICWAVAISS
jgi:hypothetical protein